MKTVARVPHLPCDDTRASRRRSGHRPLGRGALPAVIAVLSISLFLPFSATAVDSGETAAAVQDAIGLRERLGLHADPVFVAQAERNLEFSRDQLGIALSADEASEIDRRRRIQEGMTELNAYLDTLGAFGGVYLNQRAGAVIEIGIAGAYDSYEADIRRLAPSEAAVNLRHVQYKTADLRATQAAVDRATDELRGLGIVVSTTAVDPKINRVAVGVSGLTSQGAQLLFDRFGPAVSAHDEVMFHAAACTGRGSCGNPMKGGLTIVGGTFACTSGFMGRPAAAFTRLYVLTAGHCVESRGLGNSWTHGGVVLGTGAFEEYRENSPVDYGGINDTESTTKNLVYTNANDSFRSITGRATNANQDVGDVVCRSGKNSGYDCGEISQEDYTVNFGDGTTLLHQWEVDFGSVGGDSGAPIIFGNLAYGIMSGTNGVRSNYGTIEWGQTQLGVRPCYSASCG